MMTLIVTLLYVGLIVIVAKFCGFNKLWLKHVYDVEPIGAYTCATIAHHVQVESDHHLKLTRNLKGVGLTNFNIITLSK